MTRLLKNKEVLRTLLLQVALAILADWACFCIDIRAGQITAVFSLLVILIGFISTWLRYRKIAALAEDIDRLLHKDLPISWENYSEGELGILQSEIYKMTVRLREQRLRLLKDKAYLADALADISHQIRTPLTSINLLVQMLSEPDIPGERKLQLTHELYGLLSRIDWLITTLLKISRLDAGTVQFKQEQITIKQLLQKACEPLLIPMDLRGQELAIQAAGQFIGDVAWTCEAVSNIVKNCMEHTPEGGCIQIEAAENPLYSQIVICDNGSGIDPEDIPHIFERFYKGKNADGNGFGVGLALARMIVTGQNGTIKAENSKSNGACFTLRFYKGAV